MPKGLLKKTVKTDCKTCGTVFEATHYLSCYCSNSCKNKNQYSKWRKQHLNKEYSLKKRYGLSIEDYNRILINQNGCCAICTKKTEKLYVDHNHKTSTIRGLLCLNCNTALGHLKDNIVFIENAKNYLLEDLKKIRGA